MKAISGTCATRQSPLWRDTIPLPSAVHDVRGVSESALRTSTQTLSTPIRDVSRGVAVDPRYGDRVIVVEQTWGPYDSWPDDP